MQTKLTLRLEESLIEAAKREAAERGVSVSQLVAEFFGVLADPDSSSPVPGPITRKLLGALKGNLDREDYRAYLEEKYS